MPQGPILSDSIRRMAGRTQVDHKKSDVMSMKVTPRIIQEDFVDPLPQDLESLFLEEDEVSAEFIIEDKGLLAADMSREMRSLGIGSQDPKQRFRVQLKIRFWLRSQARQSSYGLCRAF